MALVPVSVVAAAYPAVRTLQASSWTTQERDDDPWTTPFRTWEAPHAPRPLDAISAYREPFGPPPLLLDAYA